MTGLKLGSTALLVSIVLYGLAGFAIPAIMAAAVGDYPRPLQDRGASF